VNPEKTADDFSEITDKKRLMRLGERKKKRKQRGDTVEMLKEAFNFAPPTFFSAKQFAPLIR